MFSDVKERVLLWKRLTQHLTFWKSVTAINWNRLFHIKKCLKIGMNSFLQIWNDGVSLSVIFQKFRKLVLDKVILISLNYIKKVGVLIKSLVVHLPSTISPVEEVNTALYFLKSESQPFIETYCFTPRKIYKLARFQGPSPILEWGR